MSLARPEGLEEEGGSILDADAEAAMQHADGESSSSHILQSLVTDGHPIIQQEDAGNGVSSVDGSSAQDFFKRRG